jgi:hypothetical protein
MPITDREREAFWVLHGRIFYIAIRQFVYGVPVPSETDRPTFIADDLRQFIFGARIVLSEISEP